MKPDLRGLLTEFVEHHRGLRLAQLFGKPAAFAGRRAFAYVDGRGLAIRSRERWVIHRPRTPVDARKLLPALEVAAREIAETQGRRL